MNFADVRTREINQDSLGSPIGKAVTATSWGAGRRSRSDSPRCRNLASGVGESINQRKHIKSPVGFWGVCNRGGGVSRVPRFVENGQDCLSGHSV